MPFPLQKFGQSSAYDSLDLLWSLGTSLTGAGGGLAGPPDVSAGTLAYTRVTLAAGEGSLLLPAGATAFRLLPNTTPVQFALNGLPSTTYDATWQPGNFATESVWTVWRSVSPSGTNRLYFAGTAANTIDVEVR